MVKNKYKEVSLTSTDFDKHYRHPYTLVFQYEYALFKLVSEMFKSVRCNSMCIDSLKLYFCELPVKSNAEGTNASKTQNSILLEVSDLISQDVAGRVNFPMMHECMAEARVVTNENGTHKFLFTDGIFAFSVSLEMKKKGRPKGIRVENIGLDFPEPLSSGSDLSRLQQWCG